MNSTSRRFYCRPAIIAAVCWFLALFTPTSLSAQGASAGTITGRVLNPATGEYLRNAVVSLVGTQKFTTTGVGGTFQLTDVPAGEAKLAISYTGLETLEESVTVPAGQTVTHDVSLTNKDYDVVTLGAVRVSSVREGNARAIMEQRIAPNIKKVISADALGAVSEGNVGEFLKLMPGVAMDYVEADTRTVRLRGMNPKYATVLFDGMQVANAGSSNVGTGRAFEFEQLSITSVETVEVTKSPTPDQPSSVAGIVNLKSRSAFDHRGRRLTYSAALSANSYYMDTSATQGWDDRSHYKVLPNFEVEYSDTYLDGKLGVIAGINKSYTIAAQKHVWFFGNTFTGAQFTDSDPTLPRLINRIWYQDGPKPTKRGNYNIRLDYKPFNNFTTYGRFDYTTYNARFFNRTLNFRPTTYAAGSTLTDMTVTSGRVSIDSNQFMTKEGNTVILTSGSEYKSGNFSADLGLHYSRAKNWYGNTQYGHFTDFSSSLNNISWRMTRPDPGSGELTFTQLTGADWRNPANYTFDNNSIGWHERRSKDQQWTARVDFKNDFSSGAVPQVIKYGLLTNLKVLDVNRAGLLTANPTGPDGVMGTADDLRPINFVDNGFRANWGSGGNMNDFPALSPWLLYQSYVKNPNQWVENAASNNIARIRGNSDFKEKINAAYVSDTFKFGAFEISPGLRYETTKDDGKGINNTTNLPITGGNDYKALLKYLQGSYKFTKNLIARGSYHDAITRADIANLIPGISGADFTTQILAASNPNLKEERSKTYNVSLEYYFEPVGVVSISGFHSSIKNRQFSNLSKLNATGYEGDVQYANWTLSGPVNIPSPTTYSGVEIDYSQQLSFLPGVLRGLGVFANHTQVHFDEWAFNIGSPKNSTNAGLSFSWGRFSSRLNFNHVGKLLQNANRTYSAATGTWSPVLAAGIPLPPVYQKSRLVTDINLEFKATKNVTLFIDGRNILNEESVYTYYGTTNNPERILKTGSIWMAGVKGAF